MRSSDSHFSMGILPIMTRHRQLEAAASLSNASVPSVKSVLKILGP